MPKGIRQETSLGEDIVDLDRMLMASVKRNLQVAEKVAGESGDKDLKSLLERFRSRHMLVLGRAQPEAEKEKPTLSDRERRVEKISRGLSALPDVDLHNVMELVRSMVKSHRGEKQSRSGKDEEGKENGPMPGGEPVTQG